MRRAKIVCTMGPAVESVEKVTELINAGMNMARLNLSHGGYEEHQMRLQTGRTIPETYQAIDCRTDKKTKNDVDEVSVLVFYWHETNHKEIQE